MQRILSKMQPVVFLGSAAVVVVFVGAGAGFPDRAQSAFKTVQAFIVETFGWFYILAATLFLVFVLWLMISRVGRVRLGGDDAQPEFGYFAWFTMLFSAGMGTGLVFWGVAEPMTHLLEPPGMTMSTGQPTRDAMMYSFFHWGLHPWAIYIVFGLSIAYYHFRHDLPLAPRSLLYPLIGERIHGLAGHLVDIVATVGTLFGVATSLGLGAMQINTGLSHMTDVGQSTQVQVLIIASITAVATISVVSGIHKGIRRLSQFNMLLAAALFLFVLTTGPTVFLLDAFVSSVGAYVQNLPSLSLSLELDPEGQWQSDWTLFYWSWWISWSPFVGVFVARISRGRTVREFVISVLLVPTVATFAWLSVFGGAGLHLEAIQGAGIGQPILDEAAVALHVMLEQLPLATITSILATLLIVVFFVTSSDSGSLVDDMVTSGGHPNPPKAQRVFWAVSEGAVAAVLLIAGGLQALRAASLTSGLPMTVFLLVSCYGLMRALRRDVQTSGIPDKEKL